MKKLLILFLVVFSASAYSQCDFDVNEVDEFTGTKKIEKYTSLHKGFSIGYGVGYKLYDSSLIFSFLYGEPGYRSIVVGQGDELMLKLKNGEVVTLKSINVYSADFIEFTERTSLECNYHITNEQIKQLSNSPLVKIRHYTTEGYYEYDVKKPKYQSSLMKISDCFLNLK